jgi:hypothetical protein
MSRDTWNTIETNLSLAQVNALCDIDDVIMYLEIFARIKTVTRNYITNIKLLKNRIVKKKSANRDTGTLEKLPYDYIELIKLTCNVVLYFCRYIYTRRVCLLVFFCSVHVT